MLAQWAQRKASAGRHTAIEVDARCGRDWHLAVRASKAVTVYVRAQWAGGELAVAEEVILGDATILLPARVTGHLLIVEIQNAAPAALAAALSWTPDHPGEAYPCCCAS